MHTSSTPTNTAPKTAPRPRASNARPLQRIAGITAAAALAILGMSLGASPALAHDQLTGQSVVTSTSDESVTGVKLSFNNDIIEVGSEISVTAADGRSASDGAPVVSGRDVVQSITQPADEGAYAIEWRVVSSDGHPIQGAMTLTIDADGAGTIATAEAEREHGDDSEDQLVTTSGDSEGQDPLMTTVIIVLVVLAAAGAALAVVIGSKRRRDAMNKAVEEARENDADKL